ncbi:UbiA-like protein EboC [Fodinibius salsisoli]|uniref:UbiA-like protein EboC n=1 Tax=Fodinibius salsisoli TaxID=2820877 RepID=A0ABT3PPM0_9BACT|nr:UbiA-like protein EboC [Fodinibius salsisoli]MCW9707801.1 UbiA-like protein EboC [Fodinibius salsisoli]
MNQAKHSFLSKVRAYAELMRPANIITAFADILAGFAAAGGVVAFTDGVVSVSPVTLGWLLLSTFGLYGGGVVFNDVFDAKLDMEERPERAIPSGRASKTGAILLGGLLLISGIVAAAMVNEYAGLLALGIAICALVYDYWAKHSTLWGPLFMGSCRGGNLLLGCSVFPALIADLWFLALLPIAYIGAITLVSQGEVHGGNKRSGFASLALIVFVTLSLFLLGILPSYAVGPATIFVLVFGGLVLPPFWKAALHPKPSFIKKAIKRGVLSLILLNAALAAGFGGWRMGIIVALLLPLSILVAKLFDVT